MGPPRLQLDEGTAPEDIYFDLQAYMGTTKHMGGLDTTQELIGLCHIDQTSYVLDVGCGAGATACYLAQEYGCRVLGVDIRESMVALSRERARREGVSERVAFLVADAQMLPFKTGPFDVILCESVTTFISDKPRVLREYARVIGRDGYVGLNEEIWLKPPPSESMIAYVKRTWGINSEIPSLEDWLRWVEAAGLRDIIVKAYQYNPRRESTQLQRYNLKDMLRMLCRTVDLYLKSPAFRVYMKDRRRLPKDLFEYLGYIVLAARK